MINNIKDFGSNIQADENIKNGSSSTITQGFIKNTTIKSSEFNTYIKMMVDFLKGILPSNDEITSLSKIDERGSVDDFKNALNESFKKSFVFSSTIKNDITKFIKSYIYPTGSVYINSKASNAPSCDYVTFNWKEFDFGSEYRGKNIYLSTNFSTVGWLNDIDGTYQFEYHTNLKHTHRINGVEDITQSYPQNIVPTFSNIISKNTYYASGATNYTLSTDDDYGGVPFEIYGEVGDPITFDKKYEFTQNTATAGNASAKDSYTYTENLKHINCYIVRLT